MRLIIPALVCLAVLPLTAANLYEQLSDSTAVVKEPVPSRFRFSYEVIPLSDTEEMGTVGTHFEWHPFQSFEPFYAGFGFYSAARGDEGGFFTFGYTVGLDYKLYDRLHADAGIYFGGGGGGHLTFPGGGMIVRTHAALSYALRLEGVSFSLGLARTDFPNTENEEYKRDLHPFAGININDAVWRKTSDANRSRNAVDFDGLFRDIRITPAFVMYDVDDKPTKRAIFYSDDNAYQDDFPMIGIQFDRFVTDAFFVSMEGYGAVGSAAGYAAVQVGLGYDLKLADMLVWESKMVGGFAGDGRIDTGGGFIVQPMTGLRLQMTPSLSFKTLAGRTYAPQGLFSATTYEAGLTWQASRPVPKKGSYLFCSESFENLEWVMSPSYKAYFPFGSDHKKSKDASEQEITLIGITLSAPLSSWFSLMGSTYWAMTGNTGSYAEGLFGAKLSTPAFTPLNISANVRGEIGAGAGAGINTSSGGYVTETLAGLELPLSEHTALDLEGGRMQTSDGKFKADTLLLSLNINLNFTYKK